MREAIRAEAQQQAMELAHRPSQALRALSGERCDGLRRTPRADRLATPLDYAGAVCRPLPKPALRRLGCAQRVTRACLIPAFDKRQLDEFTARFRMGREQLLSRRY